MTQSELAPIAEKLSKLYLEQGSRHFPPLVAHFDGAAVRGDPFESLPLSVLAEVDPKLIKFCTKLDARCERDPALRVAILKEAALEAPSEVQVKETEGGGLWLQRAKPRASAEGAEDRPRAQQQQFEVVFAPADKSCALRQETVVVEGGEYFLHKIAALLGLPSAAHLLLSRDVGKRDSGLRMYSQLPSPLPTRLSTVPPPPSPPLHPGASWVGDQDIRGDVVVAAVGSCYRSPPEGHRVWTRDVTRQEWVALLHAHSPEGLYQKGRGATLGQRLPTLYSCGSKWKGSPPPDLLLLSHLQHHKGIFKEPPHYTLYTVDASGAQTPVDYVFPPPQLQPGQKKRKQESSEPPPGRYSSTLLLRTAGGCLQATSRTFHRLAKDSVQGAALEALQRLQARFRSEQAALVLPWVRGEEEAEGAMSMVTEGAIDPGTKGEGPLPHPGCLVKLGYKMVWPPSGTVVEEVEGVEVEVGSGALVAPLEEWVSRMRAGQTATGQIKVGPAAVFYLAGVPGPVVVHVELRLVACTLPPEERLEAALFAPPLSKQRLQVALDLIDGSTATSVIDLGCGDGTLLRQLSSRSEAGRLVGVDVSHKGLKQAAKALRGLRHVSLYSGSIAEVDERFCDFDLAVCLEVIEHLDPEPLAAVGPTVLGGLRPKTFLVSTPNVEYNAVIQRCTTLRSQGGLGLGGGTLRNEDHRFEWTRVEFEAWARKLGGEYGYEVEWRGVGCIEGEEEAGVGYGTQMAVFRRTGAADEVAVPEWLPKAEYSLWQNAEEEAVVAVEPLAAAPV